MVVTSLTRKEAREIYQEIRDTHETDFYWYVEALVEILENHGWRKINPSVSNEVESDVGL